jgi:hypothetical protein
MRVTPEQWSLERHIISGSLAVPWTSLILLLRRSIKIRKNHESFGVRTTASAFLVTYGDVLDYLRPPKAIQYCDNSVAISQTGQFRSGKIIKKKESRFEFYLSVPKA